MELFERLGFKKNPFSTFSAEEELDFIDKIFVDPLYLQSLKEDICNGHSRFIMGARGVGKTSLIYKLQSRCDQEGYFSVIVDEFEGLGKSNNKAAFLKLIIEIVVRDFCIILAKQPNLTKKLNTENKEKLAFIINFFFKTLSKTEYQSHFNRITNFKTKNILKKIYNMIFNKPINVLVSGAVEIISDSIRKSLGLPNPETNKFYKAYIPEFEIDHPTQEKIDSKLKTDAKGLKNILEDLCIIINATGLKKPVIFLIKLMSIHHSQATSQTYQTLSRTYSRTQIFY